MRRSWKAGEGREESAEGGREESVEEGREEGRGGAKNWYCSWGKVLKQKSSTAALARGPLMKPNR